LAYPPTPAWGTERYEEVIRAHPAKGLAGYTTTGSLKQLTTPAVMSGEVPVAAHIFSY